MSAFDEEHFDIDMAIEHSLFDDGMDSSLPPQSVGQLALQQTMPSWMAGVDNEKLLQKISWGLLFLLRFLGALVHRLLCQATRFPRCCRWHLGIQPNKSVQRSTPVIITQGAKRQLSPRTGVGLLENRAMRKQQKIWKLQHSSGRGHSTRLSFH